jgi:hypothetical protein
MLAVMVFQIFRFSRYLFGSKIRRFQNLLFHPPTIARVLALHLYSYLKLNYEEHNGPTIPLGLSTALVYPATGFSNVPATAAIVSKALSPFHTLIKRLIARVLYLSGFFRRGG